MDIRIAHSYLYHTKNMSEDKTLAGTYPTFGFTTLPLGSFGFEGRLYVDTNKTTGNSISLSLSLSPLLKPSLLLASLHMNNKWQTYI